MPFTAKIAMMAAGIQVSALGSLSTKILLITSFIIQALSAVQPANSPMNRNATP